MFHFESLHVIVQADGSDRRLASLTQALSGTDVPKQFALIAADGTLLQQTMARFAPLVPAPRMTVVVPSAYEDLARAQLQPWRGVEIIVRAGESGARPDLLLPLGRVLARDPEANVVVTPAEHYVPRPESLLRAVEAAVAGLHQVPAVLLGVEGDRRIIAPSWIVPGRLLGQELHAVAGLVSQPSAAHAERLLVAGALWNTSVVVASGAHLWRLSGRRCAHGPADLAAGDEALGVLSHEQMPKAELSSLFLRGLNDLAVTRVSGSGWTDWMSPEHVIDSLQQPGELESLLSRIFWRQRALGPRASRLEPHAGAGLHATAA